MKLILKMGHRIPELLARAVAGDVWAIGILAAMGIATVHHAVKGANKA